MGGWLGPISKLAPFGIARNDNLFAATALCHNLTMATRNVRHFEPTGVPVLNPFGAAG